MDKGRFRKVDDIKQIVGNDLKEESNVCDARAYINKEFDLLDKYIRLAKSSSEWARELILGKDPIPVHAKDEVKKLSDNLRRAMHKISDITSLLGIKREDEIGILQEDLDFKQEGDHLHIVFPTLLPRRIRQGSPFTQEDIRKMYISSFDEFFKFKHMIYKEKVVIKYTHYFCSEREFVDHDNFETKVVTDLITAKVLLDDSPKNCAIFMDYKMGEKSHTEVDVIPFFRMNEVL